MEPKVIDISSKREGLEAELSNFPEQHFIFDGIECASREGLLQSFKEEDPVEQVKVCKLVGIYAKRRGQTRNRVWQSVQKLWWKGKEFDRHSKEYQELLDKVFEAASQNEAFKKALLATGEAPLIHTAGKQDPAKTVLTEKEFCTRLMQVRKNLQK